MARPRSAKNGKWSGIAKSHPKLFRLLPTGATLALRYYLRNGNEIPPSLKSPEIQELIKIAMTLHERHAKRVEVWRARIIIIASAVAAITGVAGLYFNE